MYAVVGTFPGGRNRERRRGRRRSRRRRRGQKSS